MVRNAGQVFVRPPSPAKSLLVLKPWPVEISIGAQPENRSGKTATRSLGSARFAFGIQLSLKSVCPRRSFSRSSNDSLVTGAAACSP
jgi:hypothetical protein